MNDSRRKYSSAPLPGGQLRQFPCPEVLSSRPRSDLLIVKAGGTWLGVPPRDHLRHFVASDALLCRDQAQRSLLWPRGANGPPVCAVGLDESVYRLVKVRFAPERHTDGWPAAESEGL